MQCVYCTAANLGRQHANGDLDAVLAEIERTVAGARERGVGRVPIFFADDEFNLPDERHPIAVLQGILDRGLAKHITWRAYFNPTPFSAEFAELVRETNGHVSITVDSAADTLLATAQKPFRRRHLDELVALLSEHGVSADLGLIFGLPGETEETIAETIDFVRALPESIEVVYSAGARVYPHTPLARIAQREPERLVAPTTRRSSPRPSTRGPGRRGSWRAGSTRSFATFRTSSASASPIAAGRPPRRRIPRRPVAERTVRLGRDPRARRPRRHAAQARRDDRRLPPGRPLARSLRPRVGRGRTPLRPRAVPAPEMSTRRSSAVARASPTAAWRLADRARVCAAPLSTRPRASPNNSFSSGVPTVTRIAPGAPNPPVGRTITPSRRSCSNSGRESSPTSAKRKFPTAGPAGRARARA